MAMSSSFLSLLADSSYSLRFCFLRAFFPIFGVSLPGYSATGAVTDLAGVVTGFTGMLTCLVGVFLAYYLTGVFSFFTTGTTSFLAGVLVYSFLAGACFLTDCGF